MKYQSLRGTKDVLPEETWLWQHVEAAVHSVFKIFGFSEIRTPIIEQTELFTRSIGDGTDIVSKEMYTFTDKGDRSITLRPECTAAVVRAAIENNLINSQKGAKLYYVGPMFRYERPQAGRQRQFHQAGIESFGSASPYADAEVIEAGLELFKKLGIQGLKVYLNSVGCEECRPAYLSELKNYLEKNISGLCDDCKNRYVNNPFRVLDCKVETCKKIVSEAPKISGHICGSCSSHFALLQQILKDSGCIVFVNDNLVRGLDYYTKTTFEIVSDDLGSQNALCGGGRYDNLVAQMEAGDIPAVGLAIGLERLISIIMKQGSVKNEMACGKVFVAAIGEIAEKEGYAILCDLRRNGIISEMNHSGKSLKSQMKAADTFGTGFVVIIGDEEVRSGNLQLKNMKTGEQREIRKEDVLTAVGPRHGVAAPLEG